MNTIRLMVVMFVAFFAGCSPPVLSPGEYNAWVENEDNELRQVKKLNEIGYQLQYKPVDYILNIENKSGEARAERRKQLEGMHYFQLKMFDAAGKKGDLLRNSVGSQTEHQQAIYYFSYAFTNQIFMIEGQDTINCELYHFVRGHSISPDLNFVFGFPVSKKEVEKQLVIHDDFFNNGLIKFNYDHQLLKNIPTLNDQLL